MEVLDNIYQHSDNREITMGVYLDLQKAFDTVNHSILILKNWTYMELGAGIKLVYKLFKQ